MDKFRTICLFSFFLFVAVSTSQAALTFYTNEASWLAATDTVATFTTTPANVFLADEVSTLPTPNSDLGTTSLTFSSANTGLLWSFNLVALNSSSDYNWVMDDTAFAESDTLSTGDADFLGAGNDDWEVSILSGPSLFGFAFELGQNDINQGDESLSIYSGTTLLGVFTAIPVSSGTVFLGITSDIPVTSIVMNEVVPLSVGGAVATPR